MTTPTSEIALTQEIDELVRTCETDNDLANSILSVLQERGYTPPTKPQAIDMGDPVTREDEAAQDSALVSSSTTLKKKAGEVADNTIRQGSMVYNPHHYEIVEKNKCEVVEVTVEHFIYLTAHLNAIQVADFLKDVYPHGIKIVDAKKGEKHDG